MFLYVIWIRFENYYVLEFNFILDVFWYLKPFCLTMFWVPPMGIYVGTETSFILGFAIDLCVVFGPCHQDNMAIVTETVQYMYYIYIYIRICIWIYICIRIYFWICLICYLQKKNNIFYFVNQTKCFVKTIAWEFCSTYVYLFLTNMCLIRLDKDIGYLLGFPTYSLSFPF